MRMDDLALEARAQRKHSAYKTKNRAQSTIQKVEIAKLCDLLLYLQTL
jgi:hypothetical protein